MEEVFNPSLIISLGPSSKKALDFSKKLLAYLPEPFLNLIDYYSIESIEKLSKDVQDIIDTRLLSAKYLNRLVDLGYKVRSENISSVKLNLYFLWDVYNSEQSAYEAIKILTQLNYGNLDKEQHSGVSLFIIPIMDKKWTIAEDGTIESMNRLKEVVSFISEEENILRLDSKVYVMHCISNDGTRIPMEELEYVCGILTYLNVLPSKEPPLSQFNHRLLMEEKNYKVGTIGITSLTVFKNKLLEDFSKYMAFDVLAYAAENEENIDYKSHEAFNLINYEKQKNTLNKSINIEEKLASLEDFNAYETYMDKEFLPEAEKNIEGELKKSTSNITGYIADDLKSILFKSGLKEGLRYVSSLETEISKRKNISKASSINTSDLSKELQERISNYPNLIGYSGKCLCLALFLLYSIVSISSVLPSNTLRVVISAIVLIAYFALAYVYYNSYSRKLEEAKRLYKEALVKKYSNLINLFIQKTADEEQKIILDKLLKVKQRLINCINNCQVIAKSIKPNVSKEENLGNLVTELLDFEDRFNFYQEKRPGISGVYMSFFEKMESYKEFEKDEIKDKLINFTDKISQSYANLDFFELLKFKFKGDVKAELSRWIEKGTVKSKYMLQYINNDTLEEHSFFISSPEVFSAVKDMIANKLPGFQVSIIEGKGIYTDSISLIRLCLGVDFDNIASIREIRLVKKGA